MELFKQEACARLPGFLYSFNIADLKRRNSHLGFAVGDADIAALGGLLEKFASGEGGLVARTSGERWFLFLKDHREDRIRKLLDGYALKDAIRVGWQIVAEKDGRTRKDQRVVSTTIGRSVRCLYTEVMAPSDLNGAVAALEGNDYSLPINRPLRLADVAAIPRSRWRCIAQYPAADPACPFCGGRNFAWEGGDDTVYSGYGKCIDCGAEISISMAE
jgi:GGDEF domain-containing protein